MTTYLCYPIQQPSQHFPSLQFGPLHDLQLHDHGVYLGHDAADGVLHAVHSSHQAVGNRRGAGQSHPVGFSDGRAEVSFLKQHDNLKHILSSLRL